MRIGVVNAALAAIGDELHGADATFGASPDRFLSVMSEKPPKLARQDKPQAGARRESSSKMNPAFDSWLENKLHNIFDAVASEPLPPDLVKLLEQLDKKTQDPKGGNKDGAK